MLRYIASKLHRSTLGSGHNWDGYSQYHISLLRLGLRHMCVFPGGVCQKTHHEQIICDKYRSFGIIATLCLVQILSIVQINCPTLNFFLLPYESINVSIGTNYNNTENQSSPFFWWTIQYFMDILLIRVIVKLAVFIVSHVQ